LWPTAIGIVIGFGTFMLPIGFGAPTLVALATFAVAGLLWPPYSSLSTTLFQHSTTPALLPRVLAAASSVRVLSVPLGVALGGPLVAGFGASAALQFSAMAIAVLGLAAAGAMALRVSAARRSRKISSQRTLEPAPADDGAGQGEKRFVDAVADLPADT
jgi:hypothetical protein